MIITIIITTTIITIIFLLLITSTTTFVLLHSLPSLPLLLWPLGLYLLALRYVFFLYNL
jgi:hypothetical protein